MPNNPPNPVTAQAAPTAPIEPTAPVAVVIPKEVIEDAESENHKRDFTLALLAARTAQDRKPAYVAPPVPTQIAENTRLEMEAGRKRVAEFAAQEAERKALNAHRKPERWEGTNVPVFRPADYVPDPKKNQGHNQARNA